LKNTKNYFIEAKIDKLTESVIPQQTLLQHQLGYETLFSQNMTNITFIFETSPNTKPKEWGDIAYYEKWKGHSILCPPRLKKWGGHVPLVPNQIAPMVRGLNSITLLFHMCG